VPAPGQPIRGGARIPVQKAIDAAGNVSVSNPVTLDLFC
jgi:hypothetical protein